MRLSFVALDFETANERKASACAIGMVKVIDGVIVEEFYSLIDPESYFNGYNVHIHQIDEKMVKGKPTYPELLPKIIKFIDGLPVVAHNAHFDMGVIRESNERYGINNFRLEYFDSLSLYKTYFKLINYKLSTIAKEINFKFQHHVAIEDAKACAMIIHHLMLFKNFSNLTELLEDANYTNFGVVDGFEIQGFYKGKTTQRVLDKMVGSVNEENFDKNHEFYQKHACFTGKLQSMTRKEAENKFILVGGMPQSTVNKQTNYLIMGDQDFRKVGKEMKSKKLKYAEKLFNDGQDIQFLSEEEFLKML